MEVNWKGEDYGGEIQEYLVGEDCAGDDCGENEEGSFDEHQVVQ